MKRSIFIYLFSLAIVFGLIACNSPIIKDFDQQLASNLQTTLNDAVDNPDNKFQGALLYVSSPKIGTWTGAAGLSDINKNIAMQPDNKFRAASILKPFISVVILQLVEEHQLSLDDLLTSVLPDNVTSTFSNSSEITVRMLLNHTSGIPDWLTNDMMGEIAGNPLRVWEVNEYLDIAASQEPYFPPGKGWKYSNTDYNLLGLIIEQITGNSWRDEVKERIIIPLELRNTRLPEPGDLSISDNHAHGYFYMGENQIDFTKIDPSMAGAAGGHAIITSTEDLAQFIIAVMNCKLFRKRKTLDEMLEFVKVPENVFQYKANYGLGIMKFLLFDNIMMVGHSGSTGGFQSFVYYFPNQNLTVSGMMNNTESNEYQILLPVIDLLLN